MTWWWRYIKVHSRKLFSVHPKKNMNVCTKCYCNITITEKHKEKSEAQSHVDSEDKTLEGTDPFTLQVTVFNTSWSSKPPHWLFLKTSWHNWCEYLQYGDLQRDVVHFFGTSDELQTVGGVAICFQGKFLLSELKHNQQNVKYTSQHCSREIQHVQSYNTTHKTTHWIEEFIYFHMLPTNLFCRNDITDPSYLCYLREKEQCYCRKIHTLLW